MLALSQADSPARARRPLSPSLLAQYVHGREEGRLGPGGGGLGAVEQAPLQSYFASARRELVFPDLMRKRFERSTVKALEKRSQVGLQNLLSLCREAERRGKGPECTQFSSLRRMRGVDVLYDADEGGEEEEEGGEDGLGPSRVSTPQLTRPSTPGVQLTRPSTPGGHLTRPSTPGVPPRPSSQQSIRQSTAASGASIRTGGSRGRRRSSVLATGNLATKRAAELLRGVPFFQRLEEQTPGVLAQMTVGATFMTQKAGQVIFRQGDPPSSCYIVASGEVVCRRHAPSSPQGSSAQGKQKRPRLPTPRERYDPRMFLSLTEARLKGGRGREVNGVPRFMTTEGFSTFSDQSLLGEEVARIGPGGLFGERALQEDDVRAASVVCVGDCELVVIQSTLYKQVMRESIEKVAYLNQHLHGLKSLPYSGAEKHPAILFVLETFLEGHTFLHEGIVAVEPALYVIKRGTVEFRRFSHASHCPANALSDRPLAQPAREPGLIRCRGARSEGALAPWAPGAGKETRGRQAGEFVWDTLCEGDVFSSLAILPLLSPEPFTVLAATRSGCEVYRAQGVDLLGLSVKLLKPLRRQLLKRMQTRLLRLPGAREAD